MSTGQGELTSRSGLTGGAVLVICLDVETKCLANAA